MGKTGLILTLAILARLAAPMPALAWDVRDDDRFSFLFHRYGDDMDRPAITPERPYWHADDAVPPAERWHDRAIEIVDQYGFTVGARVPQPEVAVVGIGVGVETGIDVLPPPVLLPRTSHRPKRRTTHKAVARRDCPPGTPLPSIPPPAADLPSAPPPARAEQ